MKKFVSIVLALTMVLALGLSAYALEVEGATTGETSVKIELGDPCITWEIPAEITIDASTGISSGEDSVSASTWKVESGKIWKIFVDGNSILLSGEFGSGLNASVTFSDLELGVMDSPATGSVSVEVSGDEATSLTHLAGTYTGSIVFECTYEDVN